MPHALEFEDDFLGKKTNRNRNNFAVRLIGLIPESGLSELLFSIERLIRVKKAEFLASSKPARDNILDAL